MVLIFDGNSEHVTHALRKIGICYCSPSNQMPSTAQITFRYCSLRAHSFLSYHLMRTIVGGALSSSEVKTANLKELIILMYVDILRHD